MKTTTRVLGVAVGITVLTFAGQARALEKFSPMQPGVSTGTPVGALPPPGLYFSNDIYFMTGEVVNGSGHSFGVKMQGAEDTPFLLWTPGVNLLGASYGVGIIQPYAFNTFDLSGVGGPSITSAGFYNTILIPEILSWNLGGGNFVSEGLSLYLPDGHYSHDGASESLSSYANNYMTFEPNFAYSYLGKNCQITANNTFDFNTKDNATDYHSGDTYYLDLTALHNFGALSLGVVGNYVQQFTDDTQFGQAVPNTGDSPGVGNRYMHVGVGPMIAYHIGIATFSMRLLAGVAGANGGNPTFVHFAVSLPIS